MSADNEVTTPVFTGSFMQNFVNGQENDSGLTVFTVRADWAAEDCSGWDPADPKSVPGWAEKALAAAIAQGKTKLWNNKVPGKLDMPFRDGNDHGADELTDCVYANPKSYRTRSPVIGPDGKALLQVDDTTIYSGAKYRARIRLAPYSKAGKNGIGMYLVAIQKVAEGERRSGGISEDQAEKLFGAVEGESDALDDDFLN